MGKLRSWVGTLLAALVLSVGLFAGGCKGEQPPAQKPQEQTNQQGGTQQPN